MAHVKKSADTSESSVKEEKETTTTQEEHICWAGVHVSFLQGENNELKS